MLDELHNFIFEFTCIISL